MKFYKAVYLGFTKDLIRQLCKIAISIMLIMIYLSFSFVSVPAFANDWYKNYDLKKQVVNSQNFNSSVTFYKTSKHENTPSITLIHGVGGSAEDFKDLVNVLSKHYDLILLDLPGFGLSKSSQSDYSPNKYAKLLIELLPSMINKTNYIVGHSMGGNVSVQIALQSPFLAKKLILIDAAGFLNKFSYSEHITENYITNNISIAETYSPAIKNIISLFNQYLPDPSTVLLSSVGRKFLLKDDANSISAIAVMDEDLSPIIRKKSPPTLILWGGKDQVMPVQVSTMLSYLLNTNAIHIFENAGHSPQKQYPDEVSNKIINFITEKQQVYKPYIKLTNTNITVDCDKVNNLPTLNNTQLAIVTINNCNKTEVSHLNAEKIILNNSTVIFNHLVINNKNDYALILHNSNIDIWGGNLTALTIAYIQNSKIEFNGVELYARNELVISDLPTSINASLTKTSLNNQINHWHGIINIGL
jgi:pimeloyl-ACP methyl ester carboxylesterase